MRSMDIGVMGLAVMGQNLVLNIESRGYSVVVYNRTAERTRAFIETRTDGKRIEAAYDIEEFVASLSKPRKVFLMVKAGAPTDALIDQLLPLLEPGDILMDGGNAQYEDTDRRCRASEEHGVLYLGVGVSGGVGVGGIGGMKIGNASTVTRKLPEAVPPSSSTMVTITVKTPSIA